MHRKKQNIRCEPYPYATISTSAQECRSERIITHSLGNLCAKVAILIIEIALLGIPKYSIGFVKFLELNKGVVKRMHKQS